MPLCTAQRAIVDRLCSYILVLQRQCHLICAALRKEFSIEVPVLRLLYISKRSIQSSTAAAVEFVVINFTHRQYVV